MHLETQQELIICVYIGALQCNNILPVLITFLSVRW